MNAPYQPGYLAWGALPTFSCEKPCRYCQEPTIAHNGRDAICERKECRDKLAETQRECKRRCEERRRRRLARGAA